MKNFKKWYLLSFIVLAGFTANSQKVALKVGTNPTTIDAKAVLEIESTTKGLLLPRMSTAQRNAITATATTNGMQIYDTTIKGICVFNGTVWECSTGNNTGDFPATVSNTISGTNLSTTVNAVTGTAVDLTPAIVSKAWSLTGNAGTNPATNFIGTTGAQDLVFKTNNTEKMKLTSVGRVGIGVGSRNPIGNFEVVNDSGLYNNRGIISTNYGILPIIGLQTARGSLLAPSATMNGDYLGYLSFNGHNGSSFGDGTYTAGVIATATENWNSTNNGAKLGFWTTTNGTKYASERMTINSNGNVQVGLFGTTALGYKFEVLGSIGASAGMASPSYGSYSDIRLKRNIKNIDNALQTVTALRAVSYEKKETIEATDYKYKENGFIAQELRKVLPDLVIEGPDKDKILTVNYTAIIPILTKAIQEQQEIIVKEQEKNKQLEARLKAIEAKLHL